MRVCTGGTPSTVVRKTYTVVFYLFTTNCFGLHTKRHFVRDHFKGILIRFSHYYFFFGVGSCLFRAYGHERFLFSHHCTAVTFRSFG